MATSKTLTGAHVKVYANGDYVGIITGGSYRIGTPNRAIYCIDQSTPAELAPTIVQVQGSFSIVRLHGTGGVEGAGLMGFPEELLRQKYLTLTLVDRRTDMVVMEVQSALVADQQWTVARLVTGSFTFQGTTYTNEAET